MRRRRGMRVANIKHGDIVFLQSESKMLASFFAESVYSRIFQPFVLVTHNSDASVPTPKFTHFLESEKILAWFTQNQDATHPKLFPVPIGFANTRWGHGNVSILKKALCLYRKPFQQRKKFIYINFSVWTNQNARSKALQWAQRFFLVNDTRQISHEAYLQEIGDSKFVLSPPGNGIDCHRTWEALLMGAVPIVLHSNMAALFANESILVINDWEQIDIGQLRSLSFNIKLSQKLTADYWYKRLKMVAGRN